jgi:hypothetical protein
MVQNVWTWRVEWNDSLSVEEAVFEQDLLNLLYPFKPCLGAEDRHRWITSSVGIFTVNGAYMELLNRSGTTS